MDAILVRVGVDQEYGKWNAPADPESGRFLYVPRTEEEGETFLPGHERTYDELQGPLHRFHEATRHPFAVLPATLRGQPMHLDPDFEHLTYGDVAPRRASQICTLVAGDLLVFYSGLRPPSSGSGSLVYGIIGLFVVDQIVDALAVPSKRRRENAHTRRANRRAGDIVVRAAPRLSGRCSRLVSIGEYRNRAYRVRRDLLEAWGELSVHDGFIQRSARPPRFLDAARFRDWWDKQAIDLVPDNFGF